MNTYACLVFLIITVQSQFGGLFDSASSLINSASSTASSATDTVTSSINQLTSASQSIISSAENTIKSTANTAISSAEHKFQQLQDTTINAVNTAVKAVEDQVNSIVDTIDNLSAEMCESQCTSFFNLPCFVLFRCNEKIKKFFLAIVLPILIVILMCLGCSVGLFTPRCFCKAFMIISGLSCIIWLIERNQKKQKEEKDKRQQHEEIEIKNEKKREPKVG